MFKIGSKEHNRVMNNLVTKPKIGTPGIDYEVELWTQYSYKNKYNTSYYCMGDEIPGLTVLRREKGSNVYTVYKQSNPKLYPPGTVIKLHRFCRFLNRLIR